MQLTATCLYLFLPLCCALSLRANDGGVFSGVYVAATGGFACRYDEIQKINDSIPDARALADAAASALNVLGSEDAVAYSDWFGAGEFLRRDRHSIFY